MSLKHFCSIGFPSIDSRRPFSQIFNNDLHLNSFGVYVSRSRLLMCSSLWTIHSPMRKKNDTAGSWEPCCAFKLVVIKKTVIWTLLHPFTHTSATYIVLETLLHLIWFSVGGSRTFHWNRQCDLENAYCCWTAGCVYGYTTDLIGSSSKFHTVHASTLEKGFRSAPLLVSWKRRNCRLRAY